MKIISSPILGNIVGIVSLLLGIISIGITIFTLKTAKSIEKEIKKKQIEALDKSKFNKNKHDYISKLKQKRTAVMNQCIVSRQICNQVLSILDDILAPNILNLQDRQSIEHDISILKNLIADDKKRESNPNTINEFDKVIANTIAIIEKGEYEL